MQDDKNNLIDAMDETQKESTPTSENTQPENTKNDFSQDSLVIDGQNVQSSTQDESLSVAQDGENQENSDNSSADTATDDNGNQENADGQSESESAQSQVQNEEGNEANQNAYVFDENNTPVVDETAPVPSAEELNEALKPKLKEKMSKKKRIAIAVISTVLVVAVVLSIVLPIVFWRKDKIFVSSAEDFINGTGGKYYYLEKDLVIEGDLTVEKSFDIDLNGHTLTVNGTFTYGDGSVKHINIGTKKGDSFVNKGAIIADNIVFNAENSAINLYSPITADTLAINSKQININATVMANGNVALNTTAENADNAEIQAQINVNANMDFGSGEKAVLNITDCPSFNVKANIATTVYLYNVADMRLESVGKVNALVLDDKSNVVVRGSVANYIEQVAITDEGEENSQDGTVATIANKVVLIDNYSCPVVRNVATLAIERKQNLSVDIYNCGTVKYIDRLQAPIDINIDERNDGSLTAVSSQVLNAQAYMFSIDGNDWIESASNEMDITSYLTSQTGAHFVKIYAKGNYSYDNPYAIESENLYLDSSEVTCEYVYRIELDTPTNLKVSQIENSYLLTFNKVAFATKYAYYINGKEYVFTPENTDDSIVAIDISDKLPTAGTYAIRVVAKADSADITDSKPAMTSTIKYQKLDAPVVEATVDSSGTVTTVNIQKQEGVNTTYKITVNVANIDGTYTQINIVTSNTTFTLSGVKAGDTITVVAQQSGAYTQSDATTVTVAPYTPPTDTNTNQ